MSFVTDIAQTIGNEIRRIDTQVRALDVGLETISVRANSAYQTAEDNVEKISIINQGINSVSQTFGSFISYFQSEQSAINSLYQNSSSLIQAKQSEVDRLEQEMEENPDSGIAIEEIDLIREEIRSLENELAVQMQRLKASEILTDQLNLSVAELNKITEQL